MRKLPKRKRTSWKQPQQANSEAESGLAVGGGWKMTTVGTGFPFQENLLEPDSGGDRTAL